MTGLKALARVLLLVALLCPSRSHAVENTKWAIETALGIPTMLAFSAFDYTLISTLPQPLVLGTEVSCEGKEWFCSGLRAYADIGYLHYPFSNSQRSVSMFSFETGVRYFPWAGPLYGSLGLGVRKNLVSADLNTFKLADGVAATDAELSLFSLYAAPEVGGQFPIGKGWSISVACGLQYSLYSSGSLVFFDRNTGLDSNTSADLATQSAAEIGRIAGLLILRTALRFSYAF